MAAWGVGAVLAPGLPRGLGVWVMRLHFHQQCTRICTPWRTRTCSTCSTSLRSRLPWRRDSVSSSLACRLLPLLLLLLLLLLLAMVGMGGLNRVASASCTHRWVVEVEARTLAVGGTRDTWSPLLLLTAQGWAQRQRRQ